MEQEYTYEYDGMSQLIRAVLSQTTTKAEGKKEKEKETATSHTFAGNSPRTRKTSWLSSNMWKAGRQKMISWKNCALLPLL